jgi:NTP pyrophosphatase (non-canonical NTP hydrolase)
LNEERLKNTSNHNNKNMNELVELVKQWGLEKGITGPNGKATILSQLSKTQEELTETRDAAVKCGIWPNPISAKADLKDGIGDTTVTLILAAELAGLDFEECLQAAYDEIKDRTGTMIGGTFVKDK